MIARDILDTPITVSDGETILARYIIEVTY